MTMKLRREVRSMTACPPTSSLSQLRNYVSHGEGRSLFGSLRPVGRRTRTKRVPHDYSVKAILSLKALEDLDADVAADSPVQKKSSKYRGVTKHRVTERYEAHLWDKSAFNVKQNKKGRQVYLGAYDEETSAAHAYDLAALKYWGPGTSINFKKKQRFFKRSIQVPRCCKASSQWTLGGPHWTCGRKQIHLPRDLWDTRRSS